MAKKYMFFFILIYLITNSITKDNSFNTIKLEDLKTTPFSMNNKYIIFEYDNHIKTEFNSSINFIFSVGKKSSTKVYIYDSLDKISMTDDGFEGYLNKTTLDSTKCFLITITFIEIIAHFIWFYMIWYIFIIQILYML